MSSSQTDRADPKGVDDDGYGRLLNQTAPHCPQGSTGSLENRGRLALTTHTSDQDQRAEEGTCVRQTGDQMVTATTDGHPAGYPCAHTQGSTGCENTEHPGARFETEHNMSCRGSTAKSPEVVAVESTHRVARAPSKSRSNASKAVADSHLQCPNGPASASLTPKHQSLGHRSKPGSGRAAAACKTFHEQVMRIPAEICQMIMDMLFEEAVGPRRVHPHRDPTIMNIFLALDRELYRKLYEQYWTKNTWVISKGPLNKTMRFMTEKPYNETTTEFSLQTPNKAALQIRSVELSFSNADTPDLSEWQHLAEQSTALYINPSHFGPFTTATPNPNRAPTAPRNTARARRAQRYDDIQHQLVHTWQDKFDRIAMLNLTRLTLDFTEAYDPDGLYLGVYLVPRLIPFAHGMPADFTILAPDGWTERQIRDAFLVLNAG